MMTLDITEEDIRILVYVTRKANLGVETDQ